MTNLTVIGFIHGRELTRPTGGLLLAVLLALTTLLAACSTEPTASDMSASGTAITLAALPAGVGRGFPLVQIDKADQQDVGLQEGQEPPNFHLMLADGRHLSLRELRGQLVLLNFWASWCGPCRLEMPEIVATAQTHPDLIVLAINVQESIEQIQPFAEEFQLLLPVVRDADGQLRNHYAVRGMPTSIFIDRQGKIFTTWPGMLTADLLQEILADMG